MFSQSSLLASQCGSPSCCSIRSRFAGLAFFGVASLEPNSIDGGQKVLPERETTWVYYRMFDTNSSGIGRKVLDHGGGCCCCCLLRFCRCCCVFLLQSRLARLYVVYHQCNAT